MERHDQKQNDRHLENLELHFSSILRSSTPLTGAALIRFTEAAWLRGAFPKTSFTTPAHQTGAIIVCVGHLGRHILPKP